MEVTSLEQLKNIKKTDIVELPSFEDGTPFVAELKKPNITALMIEGKIPNTLLTVASDMFQKGTAKAQKTIDKAIKEPKDLQEMFKLLDVMAKNCLVNPSYKDLEDIGIKLNEAQLSAILAYTQGGVIGLENFRKQSGNI